MTPKRNLNGKDTPGKKQTRKMITLEQKVDIIMRHDRGESTNTIRNVLNLPESTLWTIRKTGRRFWLPSKQGQEVLLLMCCLASPPS